MQTELEPRVDHRHRQLVAAALTTALAAFLAAFTASELARRSGVQADVAVLIGNVLSSRARQSR